MIGWNWSNWGWWWDHWRILIKRWNLIRGSCIFIIPILRNLVITVYKNQSKHLFLLHNCATEREKQAIGIWTFFFLHKFLPISRILKRRERDTTPYQVLQILGISLSWFWQIWTVHCFYSAHRSALLCHSKGDCNQALEVIHREKILRFSFVGDQQMTEVHIPYMCKSHSHDEWQRSTAHLRCPD